MHYSSLLQGPRKRTYCGVHHKINNIWPNGLQLHGKEKDRPSHALSSLIPEKITASLLDKTKFWSLQLQGKIWQFSKEGVRHPRCHFQQVNLLTPLKDLFQSVSFWWNRKSLPTFHTVLLFQTHFRPSLRRETSVNQGKIIIQAYKYMSKLKSIFPPQYCVVLYSNSPFS